MAGCLLATSFHDCRKEHDGEGGAFRISMRLDHMVAFASRGHSENR